MGFGGSIKYYNCVVFKCNIIGSFDDKGESSWINKRTS